MKLDLDAIYELNPPGLLNLRPMLFVVEVITKLVAQQVPGSAVMLKLVRALGRYQKQVRENEAYNLNVKIKAWVLAKAERRAWVRGIIGKAAIRRWQWRLDNLNTPVAVTPKPVKRRQPLGLAIGLRRSGARLKVRPYIWKQFVMADLSWLGFKSLNLKPVTAMEQDMGNWQQPRAPRGFKPVEFWDFELADDYQPSKRAEHRQDVEEHEKQHREKYKAKYRLHVSKQQEPKPPDIGAHHAKDEPP